MAFRIRRKDGSTLWSMATLRESGRTSSAEGPAVEFIPRRSWKSPRTGVAYPVAMLR